MSKRIVVLAGLVILAILVLRQAGSFLVVNAPERADLIVVLAGGNNDMRYWTAVWLMQEGYAPHLMLDVFSKRQSFGNWDVDLARDFLNRTTPSQSTVCPIEQDSTYAEAQYLEQCIRGSRVKSILVVTSDFHTRRALAIFRKRLPQYRFSMFASQDCYYFGERWWQTREWAKTTLGEWQRYLWWLLVEQWQSRVVVH